ncbi:MAG: hypothetical protein HY367_01995, partial [Candidatus Aenigmarchaeota archaeon]|nr:hypothetical protein [Candidatus Aenigmarchaeota archaeon]
NITNTSWNITNTSGTNIVGGPHIGGNFWHNYLGLDANSDGFGDSNLPYKSGGAIVNGGDYMPLVRPVTGGGRPRTKPPVRRENVLENPQPVY